MHTSRALSQTLFLLLIACCAWFGVVLQFITIVTTWVQQGKSWGDSLIQFFSYFTILTNLIVAVTTSCALLQQHKGFGKFCAKSSAVTAVALYIIVVGLVYNLVLRSLYHPHGWAQVADEIVHSLVPLLYFIYWLTLVANGNLHWKHIVYWLIYPLL